MTTPPARRRLLVAELSAVFGQSACQATIASTSHAHPRIKKIASDLGKGSAWTRGHSGHPSSSTQLDSRLIARQALTGITDKALLRSKKS